MIRESWRNVTIYSVTFTSTRKDPNSKQKVVKKFNKLLIFNSSLTKKEIKHEVESKFNNIKKVDCITEYAVGISAIGT